MLPRFAPQLKSVFTCSLTSYQRTNDFRESQEILKTVSNGCLVPSLSSKLKILSILARNYKNAVLNFSSGALIFTKSKVCLKYLVHDRLWKHFFALNFPKIYSRPESFDSFCNNVCSKILIKKKVNWKMKCFFAKIWLLLTFGVVSKDIKNKTKKLQIMMVAIFWDLIFFPIFQTERDWK